MKFELLADLFYKLYAITNLVDITNKIQNNNQNSISIDEISLNFFKHFLSNIEDEFDRLSMRIGSA